jgi:hypothetical protein
MPDPRQYVRPGQRLQVAASQINALNEMMRVRTGFGAGGASQEGSAPYTWVYAKNTTGATVARWGVMKISGVEIQPTSNSGSPETRQFEQMPVLTCGSTGSQACVALEPIENNKIGRAAVAGTVQVRASEVSGVGGAVLWKNDHWALIRFGGGSVKLGAISETWHKGATATVTELNGDGTAISGNPTFQAVNHIARVAGTGATLVTKRVVCAQVGDTWVLVAAEC